jgi:hypothetical protein
MPIPIPKTSSLSYSIGDTVQLNDRITKALPSYKGKRFEIMGLCDNLRDVMIREIGHAENPWRISFSQIEHVSPPIKSFFD